MGQRKKSGVCEFASPRGKKGRRIFATKEEAEAYLKKNSNPGSTGDSEPGTFLAKAYVFQGRLNGVSVKRTRLRK